MLLQLTAVNLFFLFFGITGLFLRDNNDIMLFILGWLVQHANTISMSVLCMMT